MANQEDDLDLDLHDDDNIEDLQDLEKYVKRGHRIIAMLEHQCWTKIADPQEAETFNSAIEALAKGQEDLARCLNYLREAQDAEEEMEALRQAAEEFKEGGIAFFILPEAPEGDQCEEGSTGKKIGFARRWLTEKLRSEFGESSGEEGATAVVGQLRQKSAEFEANLYFLLARVASLTPEGEEEVADYEKFKSFLNLLLKDSKNEIIRGILDLMNVFRLQVGNSGSSKGKKVDKGRSIDSLLRQVLQNIQRVAQVIVQISSLAGPIEECEVEQNDIQLKIKALN